MQLDGGGAEQLLMLESGRFGAGDVSRAAKNSARCVDDRETVTNDTPPVYKLLYRI